MAAMVLAGSLNPLLFEIGVWLGERDELVAALSLTGLSAGAAWLLPPVGRVARWRIAILANVNWLSHQLRWGTLRVRAGAAHIQGARLLAAHQPDRRYLLAHGLTMEACRYAADGQFKLALPLAQEAVKVFTSIDGFNDPEHSRAAHHIAGHVDDWERGIRFGH